MTDPNIELENLLDRIPLSFTYADAEGVIRYRNRAAAQRPSARPRDIGVNIRDCHARPESLKMIDRIYSDFKQGRKTPHHYVSARTGVKELVTLVPIFKDGQFSGCLSFVHPLELKGESRTF